MITNGNSIILDSLDLLSIGAIIGVILLGAIIYFKLKREENPA